jgi:hypothetical protein
VLGVTNDPTQLNASGAPTQPIFTYNVFDPVAQVGSTLTAAQVQSGSTWACSLSSCNADVIQSVGIDLMVGRKGAGPSGANNVDEQTIVYRYAKSPGASTYPYQYGG